MADDPKAADERAPRDDEPAHRRSGSGPADPMGVVLRLPSGRIAPAATVEGATIAAAEPATDAADPESPPRREETDATPRTGVGTDSSDDDAGRKAGSGPNSHPAHLAQAPDRADWAWVEEWRAGNEPTPWASGLVLSVFSALVVGVAVWVLAAGLSDRPVIAVLVNLLVAGGLAPAIWLSRGLPVLRFVGGGAAAGIVIGWVCALLMLPLPTP